MSRTENSPFWPTPLFRSQLVKNGEDFLLKKAPLKTHRVLPPFFQKRLASKQIFRRVKHYHEWLRFSIHLKTNFSQYCGRGERTRVDK